MRMAALLPALGRYVLFYLAFLAATQVREYGYAVLDQAVVWLPTGVALAGLWLLGARAFWVVMLGAMTQRALIGYDLTVGLSAGLGSSAEALVGLVLLRKLGFNPRLERLRDVLAIIVTAAVAPLASILCSWLARGALWSHRDMAFYSGWDGWWRMNALGVMAVVPVALAWLAPPRQRRGVGEAMQVALLALAQPLLVAVVFLLGPGGVTGIMLVNFSLLVSLYAAVRYGPRGAVTAGSLAAVVVAVGTANGIGPFLAVGEHERHLSLQLLELVMVAMPLLFGALVAERRAAEVARRQLEEQLRQSQRLESVGQLAGGIAHDFNNVLTAVVGYAELIRSSVSAQDPVHGYAGGVLRASERAAALTRQLLAYSRRQVLSPQVVELGGVVQQLGDMLHRLIGEDVDLRIEVDPHGAWSLVDRSQIEQVIVNLVVNARDAMPAGGELAITVNAVAGEVPAAGDAAAAGDVRRRPHVRLAVADTGVGMDEETAARAFDPFFTTKARGKGTGLGLSTVYGIVRQSGGDIFLDSRAGQGTTVTVCLPRVAPGKPSPAAPPPPSLGPTAATILFAEDEPMVRELTAECLARAGFKVLAAPDGQAALDLASRHDGAIDLLVSDVVMPRLGGRELATRLRSTRPALRVLFISGYTDDAGDLRDIAGPGGDFLQKPFSPEALVARVRSLLGAPAASA